MNILATQGAGEKAHGVGAAAEDTTDLYGVEAQSHGRGLRD
jgi:hypothetical protein